MKEKFYNMTPKKSIYFMFDKRKWPLRHFPNACNSAQEN